MARPQCKVFLCTEAAFDYRNPGDPNPLFYCEEHAAGLGLSAQGKSFDDGIERRTLLEVEAKKESRLDGPQFPPPPKPIRRPRTTDHSDKGVYMARRPGMDLEMRNGDDVRRVRAGNDAARVLGISKYSIHQAITNNTAVNGWTFKYVPRAGAVESQPRNPETPKPLAKRKYKRRPRAQIILAGKAESPITPSPVHPVIPSSSLLAPLAALAIGARGLRLSNVEISIEQPGGMKISVKAESMELVAS